MKHTIFKTALYAFCCVMLSATLCACGPFGANYRRQMEQGRLQVESGQYEAAVVTYSAAIEENSRRADAYLGRGDAYAALADLSAPYSSEQRSYQRGALSDYKKARELDSAAATRQTLIDYYVRLGDQALSAAEDESAPTTAYGYDIADSYYRSALELDRTNGPIYGKLVALLLEQGKSAEASELLQKGLSITGDRALTAQLEALSGRIADREEQGRRDDALSVLRSVPYYGNLEACRMSAGQASACAKLIADGLNGKFNGFSGYGKPLYDRTVYWDEPYPVVGYGSYETNRAGAVLADLAADGVPYLCLFSTLTDSNSFQVYGWKDGEMKLAVGEESWGGHQNGVLTELADGSVALIETVTAANGTRSGQTFRFHDGGASVTESWYEARENGETVVRVTRDGAQMTYTPDQWEASRLTGVSAEYRDAPFTAFADVSEAPCTLRDMAHALNAWAYAVSGGASEPLDIPPEHSERHRMATAMLHQLFVLDHLAIHDDTRLCYVRLLDLNGDNVEELIAAFSGSYRSQNGTECQFALYEWRDGALIEHAGGNRFQELRLAREKAGSVRGVLGLETQGSVTRYAYTFLSGSEELQVDGDAKKYYVVKRGQPVGIAESEYVVLQGRYDALERLVDFSQLGDDRNYERVVASLNNMRA